MGGRPDRQFGGNLDPRDAAFANVAMREVGNPGFPVLPSGKKVGVPRLSPREFEFFALGIPERRGGTPRAGGLGREVISAPLVAYRLFFAGAAVLASGLLCRRTLGLFTGGRDPHRRRERAARRAGLLYWRRAGAAVRGSGSHDGVARRVSGDLSDAREVVAGSLRASENPPGPRPAIFFSKVAASFSAFSPFSSSARRTGETVVTARCNAVGSVPRFPSNSFQVSGKSSHPSGPAI